jgi:hypothetical protein
VIVAAVGNNTTRPAPVAVRELSGRACRTCSASARSRRDGSVPVFSHRDKIYNDIAAPGGDPLDLPARAHRRSKECADQGYSTARDSTTSARAGHVVRAPQVSAAAARCCSRPAEPAARAGDRAADPDGQRRQRRTGCSAAPAARRAHRLGPLDVNAALQAALGGPAGARPARAERRRRRRAAALWGQRSRIEATLDFWDDQNDVYAIRLSAASASVAACAGLPAPTRT